VVDGKLVKQLLKGATRFASSVALSPDPEQKYLYVGDGDSIAIVTASRSNSSARSSRPARSAAAT
jgi:hypothetical protein